MNFILQQGYTVKVGKEEAHQKWLIDNDERIRKATPPGGRYIGTFAAVFTSEKGAGAYRQLFELDGYASLESGAIAGKDPDSEWTKLFLELSKFIDTDWSAPQSNDLLRNVVDATIRDPKT